MNEDKSKRGKDTYIPRIMPLGAALILLMILVPLMRERHRANETAKSIEPPLAMISYSTGHERLDSLMNEGIRRFGRRDYESSARLLAEAHFYWKVLVQEKQEPRYPEDLRFFYALAQLYRGRADQAVPLLEEERLEAPTQVKYSWYLAHAYLALDRIEDARAELEHIVSMGGEFDREARMKLSSLEDRGHRDR